MSNVEVNSIDLIRRIGLFDGRDDDMYDRQFEVPGADPRFEFNVDDFERNSFKDLQAKLGDSGFEKIVEEQGFGAPKEGSGGQYWATDELKVYYYLRPGDADGQTQIALVSHGEYQPGRYKIHFEGIWEVSGATL